MDYCLTPRFGSEGYLNKTFGRSWGLNESFLLKPTFEPFMMATPLGPLEVTVLT